jgi:hypothetical protein
MMGNYWDSMRRETVIAMMIWEDSNTVLYISFQASDKKISNEETKTPSKYRTERDSR